MSGLSAVILAAGKGTRMGSDLPKVAHEVAGRPMVWWVARACDAAGCDRIVVVVGHGQSVVRGIFERWDGRGRIEFVEQAEQLGTGHAVWCAEPLLGGARGEVLVLAGDGPLVRAATLRALVSRHRETGASATMATSVLDDPAGYGRIVRDGSGRFSAIVEEKEASAAERSIREVNPSYYCFDARALFGTLADVPHRASAGRGGQGESYLTDVPGLLAERGRVVELLDAVPPEDVLSVNTPDQRAEVDAVLRARLGAEAPAGETR